MSIAVTFWLGAALGILCTSGAAWWAAACFRDGSLEGFAAAARLLRVLSARSGYQSVLIEDRDDCLVVPIEWLCRAFDRGSLLRGLPVQTSRSDRPPPLPRRTLPREDPPDGHA